MNKAVELPPVALAVAVGGPEHVATIAPYIGPLGECLAECFPLDPAEGVQVFLASLMIRGSVETYRKVQPKVSRMDRSPAWPRAEPARSVGFSHVMLSTRGSRETFGSVLAGTAEWAIS